MASEWRPGEHIDIVKENIDTLKEELHTENERYNRVSFGIVNVNLDILWNQTKNPYKMINEIKNNTDASEDEIVFVVNRYLLQRKLISTPIVLKGQKMNKITNESNNIIKLRCEDCGGTMNFDSINNVIICPFCGSKKIILSGNEVEMAKIQADVEKQRIYNSLEQAKYNRKMMAEVEKERIRNEVEINKQKEETKRQKDDNWSALRAAIICIIGGIILLFFLCLL